MARTTRQKSQNGVYHVLLRGDALFRDDEDKKYFEGLLREYFLEDAVLGYLLQENRIHLVIHSETLSKEIKPVCTAYARYYNRRYGLEGKLFSDRFRSEPLEDEEAISAVLSYLHRFDAKKKKKNELRRLAMDDYEKMSQEELSKTIFWLSGILPKPECSAEEKAEVRGIVRESGRIRIGLLRGLLGEEEKKAAPKKAAAPKLKKKTEKKAEAVKKTEKSAKTESPEKKVPEHAPVAEDAPEKPKKKKKELSVWLL